MKISFAAMLASHNLIIVTCHAISLGGSSLGELDTEWCLKSFQKGEGPTFVLHIRKGVELCKMDQSSLLLFSG